MPVSDVTPVISYVADGITTVFPFPFKIFTERDLVVPVGGVAKLLGTDYTVTVGESGGSVNFLPGSKPVAGTQVDVIRRMPINRGIQYQDFGGFRSLTVDEDLDRIVMMLQDKALSLEGQENRLEIMEASIAAAISNYSTVIVTAGAGAAATVITPSASLGPLTVDLTGLIEVIISRADDSGNELKILDSRGYTIQRMDEIFLDGPDDVIHLILIGNNWIKV